MYMNERRLIKNVAAWVTAGFVLCASADAQLTFSLTWGWQGDNRQDAAWWALNNVVNRFNAYGDFTGGNGSRVEAAYNPGVPTAQAGYGGWGGIIEYGGTWPNDRVTMHELNHWLGSGTWGHTYDGPRTIALIEQFEGVGARIGTDGTHFWPYGMNYDNEWSEIAAQRNVALMYATRADWGIGSTANPTAWNATSVTLTASDPGGTSGFNHGSTWSDNTFAHPNADYSTGAYSLRTPEGYPSWTFAGKSLTVNAGGRLLYNSWGTDGVITIDNLVLAGGTVRHDQYPQDLFKLRSNVTMTASSTFDAAQGDIVLLGNIDGTGSLTKIGANTLTLTGAGTYTGDTLIHGGTLRLEGLSPVAGYTFDNLSGNTVVNDGTGGGGMNGTLAGGATIVAGGAVGNAVSVSGGASVDINNPITNLDNTGSWTVSAWVKTSTPGGSILTKGDGSGWSLGNTIFYLGDGTAGGSGGIPSGVRWAGGFFQGSTSAAQVADNSWHQVTYVNNNGSYAIYVDGIAQPLSPGNSGFANADIGSVVRLGVSTNTVAGDGTVNFNGLLDNVEFYNQALTASQVGERYAGNNLFGSLPASTNVTIARGATLDINGAVQQIGFLAGSAASSVKLGSGELIVDTASNSQFSGAISGLGGSLTKRGTGMLTLTGSNSHTGTTRVEAGTIALTGNGSLSQSSLIEVAGGTLDVSARTLPFMLASGQILSSNSDNSVVGNVIAGSGSTLAGNGTYADNVTAQSGATVVVGAVTPPTLAIKNGGFETGSMPPGDANVDLWFDANSVGGASDWWNTAQHEHALSPTPDTGVLLGDGGGTATGVGGRWIYQEIGRKAAGDDYTISFDYGNSSDITNSNRNLAVRVEVYQGYYVGADGDESTDIKNGGLTLITAVNSPTTSIPGNVGFASFTSGLLDLSTANTTDPLWLRISNLPGTGSDNGSFVVVDNVALTRTAVSQVAGDTMTIDGDFNLMMGAIVEIALGENAHDLVEVAGAAVLNGELSVSLDASYTPKLNDAFTVLTAPSIEGDLTLGGPAGSLFSLAASSSTELILTAVSGLAGDYNNDGLVGIADYTVWRNHLGGAEGSLFNDFESGAVGIAQYSIWKSNFGATAAAVTSTNAANVPEPSAIVLILTGVLIMLRRRV